MSENPQTDEERLIFGLEKRIMEADVDLRYHQELAAKARAEVDRLRADLATARLAAAEEILRRIREDEYGGRCAHHVMEFHAEVSAAWSAGAAARQKETAVSDCPCPVKLSPGQRRCMDCPRCTCRWEHKTPGILYGVSLMKQRARVNDDPACPLHDAAESGRAADTGRRDTAVAGHPTGQEVGA